MNMAEKRIGPERIKTSYAWRSFLDHGVRLAFGTDWPVEPLNPMEGLYAAVTRKDRAGEAGEGWFPAERLSLEQAIAFYTTGDLTQPAKDGSPPMSPAGKRRLLDAVAAGKGSLPFQNHHEKRRAGCIVLPN